MTPQFILFLILALVAIASALGMLISRSAIYSALFLVLNFATVAVFFLLLNAPFIAVSQVSVYAGAIMILFLFVIMLLGAEQTGRTQTLRWQRPLAITLAVVLLLEAGYIIMGQRGVVPLVATELPPGFGSPAQVGLELFSSYLLPFEVTSVLLLVAMIGAIVLTKSEKK